MYQEWRDGLVTDFRMDVVGVYGEDTMLRKIEETVRINNAPESQLMNNKEEWNYIQLPNVALEQYDYAFQHQYPQFFSKFTLIFT